MSFDRITLLKGPGFISYAGASIHSDTDIVATLVEEWTDATTAGFARIGRRLKNRYVEVTCQPSMWLNTDVLFPHSTLQIMDTLYGEADVPLVITPRNGDPLVVLNVAVTQLANLKLSSEAATFKSAIKWTGLCANNASPASLANFFAFGGEVGSNVALTGFDPTKIFRGRYTATRNAVTLRSDKGYDIDFALQLDPDQPDGEPVCNYRLKSFEATCKFVPAALTEAAYYALLNDGIDIGAAPSAYDLTVVGPSTGFPSVVLHKTHVEPGSFAYGAANRGGELTFSSIRNVTGGALTALHTIGAVA